MSSERGVHRPARARDSARCGDGSSAPDSPSSGGIERCDPPTMLDARCARSLTRRVDASGKPLRAATAHLALSAALSARDLSASSSRAPIVAARSEGTHRMTASFVDNFSLALMRASDGIKHGTVRNESTPRVRAASNPPITQSTSCRETSSRVRPSRLTVPSPMFPGAWRSRSDRTSVGCMSREDQGGPQ